MAHHRLRSRFYRFFFSIDSLPQRLFVLSEEKLSPTERRHFCFVKKSRRPQPILAAKGQSKGEFIVSSSWKRVEKGSRRFFFGRTDDLGFEPVWVVEDHKRNEETKKKQNKNKPKQMPAMTVAVIGGRAAAPAKNRPPILATRRLSSCGRNHRRRRVVPS